MRNRNRLHIGLALVLTGLLLLIGALTGWTDHAEAKAVRVEAKSSQADKTLAYVEPFRYKGKAETVRFRPTRLYVEFADGSAFVFTPCKYEDSRNCFWWAEARGVPGGWSFIDLRGKTIYL